jgi:arsenite methyltransferase
MFEAWGVGTEERPDLEIAVRDRYREAAERLEPALCCPTAYDPDLLRVVPPEVVERDYGCGNPVPYVRRGEVVLDLGSGSGKVCFLASQVVGPEGWVIGVDVNDEMLACARRHAPEVARRIGYSNVTFKKGRIQDLALDLEALDRYLQDHPVRSSDDLRRLELEAARLRREAPLVASASVDVVVSNCVLNLVRPEQKTRVFAELFRVLRPGGRAVISDIVSDEDVPRALQDDPDLWSGCVAGALREDRFLEAFEEAGFCGVTLLERREAPWRTVEGVEFRSVTVAAYKGESGPCLDQKHAVIYRGPFRQVVDDDGHVLRRGVPIAVCAKTYRLYAREPYRVHVELVAPREVVPIEQAPPFPCDAGARRRDPREAKGAGPRVTTPPAAGPCEAGSGSDGRCC